MFFFFCNYFELAALHLCKTTMTRKINYSNVVKCIGSRKLALKSLVSVSSELKVKDTFVNFVIKQILENVIVEIYIGKTIDSLLT